MYKLQMIFYTGYDDKLNIIHTIYIPELKKFKKVLHRVLHNDQLIYL